MPEAVAEQEKKELVVTDDVKKLLEQVEGLSEADRSTLVVKIVERMTVLGLSDLVSLIEDTFGVTAAAPVAMGGFVAAGGAEEEEEEEQTAFDVVITAAGDKKIQVIKVVRSLTDLGLREAKALVDSAPAPLKEGISKEEAEKIKEELEAAGASVELR